MIGYQGNSYRPVLHVSDGSYDISAYQETTELRTRILKQRIPTIGGLVVREYNDLPSNFRYTKTLSEILKKIKFPNMGE